MRLRRLFSGTLGLREVAATLFALIAGVPLLAVAAFWVRYQLLDNLDAQLGLLLVVLLSLLGFVLLWRVTDRIEKLAAAINPREVAADARSAGKLGSSIVPGIGPVTEFGQITQAFSSLLEDLAASTERLEDLVLKLGALDKMAQLAVRIPSIQDLLALVLDRAMEVVGATIGSIMLLDSERQALRICVARGLPDEVVGVEIQIGDGIAGTVAELGQPIFVDDIETDPRFGQPNDPHYGSGALICMPVRAGEKIIGVINLARKEGGSHRECRRFGATDLQFLNMLMTHVGYAIDNARLLEEARQSAKQLRKAIEELKATQVQLIQGETLRATGQLASGTAHHLNNLLAVILGNIQLLLEGVRKPEIRHALELVEQTTADAAEVVRRMQRFSRVERFTRLVTVDLNALAREVLELARPLWQDEAQARGVQIEAALDPGEIPAVTGEPAALREIFMNLLINAVEALPEGGKIAVKTWRSGPWVHCAVTDSGVGMPDSVRERAVEPFFTTKGPKSIGLGLSVSYGIIQRHGGELAIESAEGRGTTVIIRLPLAPETAVEQPEPAASGALPLILVIEDEARVRETLVKMLSSQGHRVLQAAGAQEGLARLAAGEPVDLVLTDLGMPGMTGWELARAVKAQWPHLPVGLITGWGEKPEGSAEDRSAVDFVISKPVTLEALRKALAGWRPLSS